MDTDVSFESIGYHGGGARYFTNQNIAQLCVEHLSVGDQKTVYSKKQDFDVDMNLLGWYDTQDESGGQNLQLKKSDPNCTDSCSYTDDRTVQKYYKKKDGNWLFAFAPKYV